MVVTHPVVVAGIRVEAGVLSIMDPGTGIITTTAVLKTPVAEFENIVQKFKHPDEFFIRAMQQVVKKED